MLINHYDNSFSKKICAAPALTTAENSIYAPFDEDD